MPADLLKAACAIRLLLLLSLPALVQAQDYAYITNSGAITITAYTGPGGDVTIPGTITGLPVARIGTSAFAYSSLTSLTTPSSLTTIGSYAFENCISLTSVTLSNGVTSIGDGAFEACTNLVSITLPDSLTNLGTYVFYQCISLASVAIPNGVTSIGPGAFDHCVSLASVNIPNRVASIGNYAFYYCSSLATVTVGNRVASIGNYAFYYCSNLATVALPNSLTNIGDGAFSWCSSLAAVTVGNSVTTVGVYAFYRCTGLATVTLPNTLASIGNDAFYYCSNLTAVYFKGNAPSLDSSLYPGPNNVIVYYLPGTTGWGPTFGGLPTVMWDAQVDTSGADFGVLGNQFGFSITSTNNLVVVVEASTNLANPNWFPVGTNLTEFGSSYFSDPQWANSPARFYRLRSP